MAQLKGDSPDADGVVGIAHVAGKSGVFGLNDKEGGNGVAGINDNGNGVFARSVRQNGVYGESRSGSGVHGRSQKQFGVFALSDSDTGIFARGPKFAGYFDGHVGVVGSLTVQGRNVINELIQARSDLLSLQSQLQQAGVKIGAMEQQIAQLTIIVSQLQQVAHTHTEG